MVLAAEKVKERPCDVLQSFESNPPTKELSAPVDFAISETLTAALPALSSTSNIFSSIASRIAAAKAGYVMFPIS